MVKPKPPKEGASQAEWEGWALYYAAFVVQKAPWSWEQRFEVLDWLCNLGSERYARVRRQK